jgi:hypothetical protein
MSNFSHKEIINKIDFLDSFLKSLGFKKTKDLEEKWNLDSCYIYQPIESNYTIYFNGQDRTLIYIEIGIVSGITLNLSGRLGLSVFESIRTDYDFRSFDGNNNFFANELRNFLIDGVLNHPTTFND